MRASTPCSGLRVTTRKLPLLLVAALFLGTPILSAQTDLTGLWAFRATTGSQTFLELKQTGETIAGNLVDMGRPISGALKGNKLHLVATFTFQGQSRQIVYDGTVEGTKISLTTQFPGREPITGILERTAREVVFPPRLPLPELHDVPDNGLARTPPMGWNSWNKFRNTIDDATVRGMADAMVSSGMSKVGYTYVVVDEGWSSSRDAKGNIIGNEKFPDMKRLADYVHSKGLKIGIYSSPGPQACGGYQGSYGHEVEDAMTFAAWGMDYLKYDWCSARRIYQPTREELQGAYQKMGDALLRTGRPIVYSLCEYGLGDVWEWGAKVGANLWRTTYDISDHWTSMESIGFSQLPIASYFRPGHWNDPDMLEIGNGGMTADEYRTHMSLWSLLAAPLMAGNDLRSMTEETKEILMNTEVIAIDQEPEAKPVKRIAQEGKTEVLARPLKDNSVAVGLFNRGDQPAEVSVRWDSLNLREVLGGKVLQTRDLWKHEAVPVTGDRYTATVPVHGVVMLKVSAVSVR